MLATLKKLFTKEGEESDARRLLAGAKNEREALLLLKEARKRDEKRREDANKRLKEIGDEEQKHMDEGKKDGIVTSRKMHLVRLIKQLREEGSLLQSKVDKIYGPRLKALNTHISSLETIVEVRGEETPTFEQVEETAIKAKNMMEDLDSTYELVVGINGSSEKTEKDPEELSIIDEMNTLAEEDRLKKHEEESKKAEKEKEKARKEEEEKAKKKEGRGKSKKPEKRQTRKVRELNDFEGDDE